MFKKFKLSLSIALLAPPIIFTAHQQIKNKLYFFGNSFQVQTQKIQRFQNFIMHQIIDPISFIHFQFGPKFDCAIDQKHNLYIWKKKKYFSHIDNSLLKQQKIIEDKKLLEKDILTVKFTQSRIWAINKQGKLLSWKIQEQNGGNYKILQKNIQDELQHMKILQIQAGQNHVIALNNQGKVYVVGNNQFGQCASEGKFLSRFKKLNLPKIKKIVAGSNHSLAIDDLGNLYGWGINQNFELSQQQEASKLTGEHTKLSKPKQINQLNHIKVQNAVAGKDFTIVYGVNRETLQNEVYSTGSNKYGQLGINKKASKSPLSKIKNLNLSKQKKFGIQKLVCGSYHCLCLINGEVYGWGQNNHGQLATKSRKNVKEPILLDVGNMKVLDIFAGQHSSSIITSG